MRELPSNEKKKKELKKEPKKELNINQQKFLKNYIETGNKVRSYMDAYNNDNYKGCSASADRLLENVRVNEEYQKKIKELEKLTVLTVEQRRLKLSEEAINGAKASDRIKAVDVLNKMEGIYIDKIEADTTVNIDIAGAAKEWAE